MYAITEGVVRSPSAFSITRGLSPSSTATHEFVVPKSIPMILPIRLSPKKFYVRVCIPLMWGWRIGFQPLLTNQNGLVCFSYAP
ncbi:Uncharacterised protein [Vibrio cholerae]|nr:Uncharacterised protein [Vibrio cholerae]